MSKVLPDDNSENATDAPVATTPACTGPGAASGIQSSYSLHDQSFNLEYRDGTGSVHTSTFTFVILCHGLNATAPHVPSFAGRDTFQGAVLHSSEWHSVDQLRGKQVAVVGNGKSAVDVVMAASDVGRSCTQVRACSPLKNIQLSNRHQDVQSAQSVVLNIGHEQKQSTACSVLPPLLVPFSIGAPESIYSGM